MLRHLFSTLTCVLVLAATNATAQQTSVIEPVQSASSITAHTPRNTFDLIIAPVATVIADTDNLGGETHGVRGSGFDLLPPLPFDFTTHAASLDDSSNDDLRVSEAGEVRFGIGKGFELFPKNLMMFAPPVNDVADSVDDEERIASDTGFRWKPAIEQSLLFLAVQHGYAMTQPKTREALKGKFFKDYFRSVRSLHGWDDGGRFFTNYVAHTMQGALTGYIQVQNDPRGIRQKFGGDRGYWISRAKATVWSAVWSTQFEIGLISQASIGNVGLKGKQTWGDIVVTPAVGTGLIVLEDAIDRLTRPFIESRTNNKYIRIFSRMLLNPTRNFANLLRFEKPWKRDVRY
ncbi:MAG: hypothetical protein MSG64_16060 [Pyrinomonadaceae bacterium MAG19_C2-C3]|nr:hypothetical protein [Pyrinomonadaceae bacterium MAG19_C2-C3]